MGEWSGARIALLEVLDQISARIGSLEEMEPAVPENMTNEKKNLEELYVAVEARIKNLEKGTFIKEEEDVEADDETAKRRKTCNCTCTCTP